MVTNEKETMPLHQLHIGSMFHVEVQINV